MLKLDNISLKYEKNTVIDSLTYEFEEGKVTAVLGESGVGKTSLLNLIAGLVRESSGRITSGAKKTAFVFQEPRLFPWMSALENVSTVSDEESAAHLLELMGLSDAQDKYPAELSGGMKQRVSIARALAYSADLVLMDEPFKGLDAERRAQVSEIVFSRLSGKTVIMVTHDEADLKYADIVLRLTPAPHSQLILEKTNSSDNE